MMRFKMRGAVGNDAANLAHVRLLHLDQALVITIRGGAEHGHLRLFREAIEFEGVAQRARERLVDEQGLARLDHGLRLLQMRAAIDAHQQHGVHLLAQFLDAGDDLHAELVLKLLRVAIHAAPA